MLTRNIQGDDTTTVSRATVIPALIVALGLFGVLVFGIKNHVGVAPSQTAWSKLVQRPPADAPNSSGEVDLGRVGAVNDMGRVVGNQMLTRYALAFEVAGLLLTAALVGAVALARRETEDELPPRRSSHARSVPAAPGANGAGSSSKVVAPAGTGRP